MNADSVIIIALSSFILGLVLGVILTRPRFIRRY